MKRGQEFTVFELLIGSVFAAALLAIVYAIATQMQYPESSHDIIANLLEQATRSPGDCFSREQVSFTKDSIISAGEFTKFTTTINFNCPDQRVDCDGQARFEQDAIISVSAQCSRTGPGCSLFFGSADCHLIGVIFIYTQ